MGGATAINDMEKLVGGVRCEAHSHMHIYIPIYMCL